MLWIKPRKKTRADYPPELFRRRARRPKARAALVIVKLSGRSFAPLVIVTHRTKKQVATNKRKLELREREKKNRRNPIDYFNVPLDRATQYLLGIDDKDRENKKLVGEAIAKAIREGMAKGEKDFRNAFRCPHCRAVIFEE